ncbi:MAG: cobalamin-dependent protein [Nitrososphaeraceae archaeon]|nr:cobalamin-dependent protein [Nitrososphaeraceae archaeon]
MVYIRIKRIKNHDYAYLVKNTWINKKPKQTIVKYLGNVSRLKIEDIPEEYITDQIRTFLQRVNRNTNEPEIYDIKLQDNIFNLLKDHDISKLTKLYQSIGDLDLVDFYERMIIPVLHKIGDLWENGKLDVATEHVCSNATSNLISSINLDKTYIQSKNKGKIVLCTPEGELHNIGCEILGSLLMERGYKIFDISPSMPNQSIAEYIHEIKPDLTIISFTLKECVNSVVRLINEINQKDKNFRIVVGGTGSSLLKNKITNNRNINNRYTFVLEDVTIRYFIKNIKKFLKD